MSFYKNILYCPWMKAFQQVPSFFIDNYIDGSIAETENKGELVAHT